MIRPCSCRNPGQDKLYGTGQRVFNLAEKKLVWRCTVCLKEIGAHSEGGHWN